MKLQLTKQSELELERINALYGDENSTEYDNWDKMSKLEVLITDAGLYVDGVYEKNKFDNLEKWCELIGKSEYQAKYLQKHPNVVFNKINKMISEGILVVAE
jgi:hypothetical protein